MLDVRARRAEGRVAALAIAASTVAPWLVGGLGPALAAAISAGMAGVVALGFVQAGWLGRRRIQDVIRLSDGCWALRDGAGRSVHARLARQTRVAPGLVWLRWRAGRSMLLARGDLPAPDLRRLIVGLRLAGTGAPAADPLATNGAPVR